MVSKKNSALGMRMLSSLELLHAQFGEKSDLLRLKDKTRLRIVRAISRFAIHENLGEVIEIRSGSEVVWSKKGAS